MKTQLIQLESHDDRTSVRDRMDWAKTPRILLLWPKRRRTRIRALDLRLLQRHAKSLGAQLGLVTQSEAIRQAANELGLPVFDSANEAQHATWRVRGARRARPRRRTPRHDLRAERETIYPSEARWRNAAWARVIFFSLGVLAVLVLVAFFIPRAEVTVHPAGRTQSLSLPVTAGEEVTGVFLSGSLPARPISVVVEIARITPASGEVSLPDQPATGTVVFRNLTDSPQTVPQGTIVRSLDAEPVRFAVDQDYEVPPFLGALLQARVTALEPGTRANLPAAMVRAIEGTLGLSLSVTNPQPMAGGTVKLALAPGATDRSTARTALLADGQEQALTQMQAELAPEDFILMDTFRLEQILEETADPPEGRAGGQLTLFMRAQYSARFVSAEDLRALAEAALRVGLPEGYAAQAGTLRVTAAEEPVTAADGLTSWTMRAEQTLRRDVRPEEVIRLVTGRSPQAASARLQSALPLTSAPEIRLQPEWWPWLPIAPFRITVVFE